jgi:hypothetical protein
MELISDGGTPCPEKATLRGKLSWAFNGISGMEVWLPSV